VSGADAVTTDPGLLLVALHWYAAIGRSALPPRSARTVKPVGGPEQDVKLAGVAVGPAVGARNDARRVVFEHKPLVAKAPAIKDTPPASAVPVFIVSPLDPAGWARGHGRQKKQGAWRGARRAAASRSPWRSETGKKGQQQEIQEAQTRGCGFAVGHANRGRPAPVVAHQAGRSTSPAWTDTYMKPARHVTSAHVPTVATIQSGPVNLRQAQGVWCQSSGQYRHLQRTASSPLMRCSTPSYLLSKVESSAQCHARPKAALAGRGGGPWQQP